jgi:hypothetical protein
MTDSCLSLTPISSPSKSSDILGKVSPTLLKHALKVTVLPLTQSGNDLTDHSTLPDSFLVNTKSFFEFLEEFVLSRPCVKCHRDTVILKVTCIAQVTTDGISVSLLLDAALPLFLSARIDFASGNTLGEVEVIGRESFKRLQPK